jgi:hypothetical protein
MLLSNFIAYAYADRHYQGLKDIVYRRRFWPYAIAGYCAATICYFSSHLAFVGMELNTPISMGVPRMSFGRPSSLAHFSCRVLFDCARCQSDSHVVHALLDCDPHRLPCDLVRLVPLLCVSHASSVVGLTLFSVIYYSLVQTPPPVPDPYFEFYVCLYLALTALMPPRLSSGHRSSGFRSCLPSSPASDRRWPYRKPLSAVGLDLNAAGPFRTTSSPMLCSMRASCARAAS